jgi:hypothetical protein
MKKRKRKRERERHFHRIKNFDRRRKKNDQPFEDHDRVQGTGMQFLL